MGVCAFAWDGRILLNWEHDFLEHQGIEVHPPGLGLRDLAWECWAVHSLRDGLMVRGSIQLMKDVLARVSLTGAAPAIAQLGVGPTEAEARRLLLHNWPEATVRVADASRAALLARKPDCPLSFACEDKK